MNPVWTCSDSLQPGTAGTIGNGVMYFASATTGTIRILDLQSGQLLDPPNDNQPPDTPWQTPSYVNGGLYAADDFGNVFSIDQTSGNVVWRQPVSTSALSSPLVSSNTLYVADNGNLYALSASGQTSRVYQSPLAIDPSSQPLFTSPTQIIIAEGTADPDGDVNGVSALSLNGASASRAWTQQFTGLLSPAAAAGGAIYLCSGIANLFSQVVALNPTDGSVIGQSMPFAGTVQYAPCVQSNGSSTQIFVATDQGLVISFDGGSSAPTPSWSVNLGVPIVTPPVISNGVIYVGGNNQLLYAVPVSGGSGNVTSYNTGSNITGIAGAANGIVYVATAGGIQAIDPASAAPAVRTDALKIAGPPPIRAAVPAADPAMTWYSGTGTGNVAFNVGDGAIHTAENVVTNVDLFIYPSGGVLLDILWAGYVDGNTAWMVQFSCNPTQVSSGLELPSDAVVGEPDSSGSWTQWGGTGVYGSVHFTTAPSSGWAGDYVMSCNAAGLPALTAGDPTAAIKLATVTVTLALASS